MTRLPKMSIKFQVNSWNS